VPGNRFKQYFVASMTLNRDYCAEVCIISSQLERASCLIPRLGDSDYRSQANLQLLSFRLTNSIGIQEDAIVWDPREIVGTMLLMRCLSDSILMHPYDVVAQETYLVAPHPVRLKPAVRSKKRRAVYRYRSATEGTACATMSKGASTAQASDR
jgi:hypothetical protein